MVFHGNELEWGKFVASSRRFYTQKGHELGIENARSIRSFCKVYLLKADCAQVVVFKKPRYSSM